MKLEIGYNTEFEIRQEVCSTKVKANFKVLYLSDFHFNGYSQEMSEKISTVITQIKPDIILFGGDYIDIKAGIKYFKFVLDRLPRHAQVYAIAGNHDYFFGIKKIRKLFEDRGIFWLEKQSTQLEIQGTTLQIDGNIITEGNKEIDFKILCLHKPRNIGDASKSYHLALAGHLHGSQFVFWTTRNKLYPGRLFYKWNILKTQINSCLYIISKGLGDTLPIRYNCRKEMVLVECFDLSHYCSKQKII